MTEATQPTPMFGVCHGVVEGVRNVSIHGDVYFDVRLRREDVVGVSMARVPSHVCGRPPAVGDRVELQFLMGQVSGLSRTEGDGGFG